MSRGGALAGRYAKALFGLAQERDAIEAVLDEIDELTEIALSDEQLRRVLFTPIHPRSERRGVVGEIAERLSLSREVQVFALLLVEENRFGQLPAIREALHELAQQAAGRMEARVTSARPLDEQETQALRSVLSSRVGADVTLKLEVDPSLIGGVVARVGDLMLDGSVSTQLESLAQNLRKGS